MTTLATVITSLFAAFALATLEFRYKKIVMLGLISLLMIPYESIIFTNYNTIARLGLLNSYTALILPLLTSIFYIYYLTNYLKSISRSFIKQTKIDGASDMEYIKRSLFLCPSQHWSQ